MTTFLLRIHRASSENKMTPANLGVVFGRKSDNFHVLMTVFIDDPPLAPQLLSYVHRTHRKSFRKCI